MSRALEACVWRKASGGRWSPRRPRAIQNGALRAIFTSAYDARKRARRALFRALPQNFCETPRYNWQPWRRSRSSRYSLQDRIADWRFFQASHASERSSEACLFWFDRIAVLLAQSSTYPVTFVHQRMAEIAEELDIGVMSEIIGVAQHVELGIEQQRETLRQREGIGAMSPPSAALLLTPGETRRRLDVRGSPPTGIAASGPARLNLREHKGRQTPSKPCWPEALLVHGRARGAPYSLRDRSCSSGRL